MTFIDIKQPANIDIYLKGIGYANLSYCVLSLGTVSFHYDEMTFLGWMYITLEVLIVAVVGLGEIWVGRKMALQT